MTIYGAFAVFAVLGGAISLNLLARLSSDIFFPWATGFTIATGILLALIIAAGIVGKSAHQQQ